MGARVLGWGARACVRQRGVWLSPAFLGGGGSFVFLTPLVGLGCASRWGGAVGWVSWLARFAALSLCAYLFGLAFAFVGERVLFFSAVHAALLVFSSWLSSCCP